ncbi:MAG: TIGR02449 family protein [Candidatus Competibacteraceae bacterium]|jgi:cell division protein ZapB
MNNENLNESIAPVEFSDFDRRSETAITDLALLADRVEQLVQLYGQLTEENRELRKQASALQAERDALNEKNEQFRARIDAMVVRLRDLEQNS